MVFTNIPRHVAIIMDGNGRWAKEKNHSRNEGHKKGSEVLGEISKHAEERGIQYLTVYAFSTENWNRPKEEVDGLMNLLRKYLKKYAKEVKKNNIRFRVIGDKKGLPLDLQEQIEALEKLTAHKEGMVVSLAINYGGRDEIVRACQKIVEQVTRTGESVALTEAMLSQALDTEGIPDPDLMIRTSGEIRTSNFLPWQLAYSEFYFTPILWPDFTKAAFDEALVEYNRRKRRFGKSE